MKNILCLLWFVSFNILAEDSEESVPDGGIYVGIGIENARNENNWEVKAVSNGESSYKKVDFSKSNNHFNGECFIGYKNYEPFFYAIELVYSFNKREISKEFDYDPDGTGPLSFPANLKIENGNDTSIVAKLGKTICSKFTPYIMLGAYRRRSNFSFKYVTSEEAYVGRGGGGGPADDSLRASGSSKSFSATRLMYGLGFSISLGRDAEIRAEYCCKTKGKTEYQQSVDSVNVDEPGYPRHFVLTNKQHCFSIAVSKNINFGE